MLKESDNNIHNSRLIRMMHNIWLFTAIFGNEKVSKLFLLSKSGRHDLPKKHVS